MNLNISVSYVNVASRVLTIDAEDSFPVTSTSAPTVVDGSVNRNSPDAAFAVTDIPAHNIHAISNEKNTFLILLM